MRERLFTPGPVEIPERVRKVLGDQIIHHRTEEFKRSFLEVRELFKRMLEEDSENFVFFASSGTGAMESAILNFFGKGKRFWL
jgi:aspartate aminotransferase-like enzyme